MAVVTVEVVAVAATVAATVAAGAKVDSRLRRWECCPRTLCSRG